MPGARVGRDQPAVTASARRSHARCRAVPRQLASVPEDRRAPLQWFADWAQHLAKEGLAEVSRCFAKQGETLLLPGLVRLVSLWRWTDDSAVISVWRSVFRRRAPGNIELVESLISPILFGQGNSVTEVSDELLKVLYGAYVEANKT